MRIDRIDLYHVAMPLISPWRAAYGEDVAVHALLCRMASGSCAGWGESAALAAPCYSPEWAGGTFAVAEQWFAPALMHTEIGSGAELQARLAAFKGNPFAKAAFDMAWWSLESRIAGVPLHRLLGGVREIVPIGADFGVMDTIDTLLDPVAAAVTAGFPRIKLKFRSGWDLPMLAAVRRQHPTHVFHIDCNAGYRLADVDLFRAVDDYGLAMIEQPLQHDDLVDHAELQRSISTPVCLDESITTVRQAEQALALGSCGWINVKPGRVGGLTNALAIHDRCRAAGIPCWVGSMLESAVGAAQCVALATLDNFTYPADIFPGNSLYHEDLAGEPLGLIRSPEGVPSVAVFPELPDPDPVRLERMAVQRQTFR